MAAWLPPSARSPRGKINVPNTHKRTDDGPLPFLLNEVPLCGSERELYATNTQRIVCECQGYSRYRILHCLADTFLKIMTYEYAERNRV